MKKLLAILLAGVMVVSLVPSAFALTYGDTEIPEAMNFKFIKGVHTDSATLEGTASYMAKDEGSSVSTPHQTLATFDYENADSDPWGYVCHNDAVSCGSTADKSQWSFYLDDEADYNADGSVDVQPYDPETTTRPRGLMFELEISESGTFIPTVHYLEGLAACVMDVYLVKKKSEDETYTSGTLANFIKSLSSDAYVGTVDLYGEEERFLDKELAPFELSEGNWFLIFVPTGRNDKTVYNTHKTNYKRYPFNYISGISFTPSLRAENVELTYNTTVSSIIVGEEITGNLDADRTGMTGMPYTKSSAERSLINGLYNKTSIYNWSTSCYPYLDSTKTDPWETFQVVGNNNSYVGTDFAHINALNGNNTNGKISTNDKFVNGQWPYFVIKIKVPYAGKYNVSVKGWKQPGGANTYFYMLPVESETLARSTFETEENLVGTHSLWEEGITALTAETEYTTIGETDIPESGEYYVVCELRKGLGAPAESVTKQTKVDINGDGVADDKDTYIRYLYEAKISSIKLTAAGLTDKEQAIADAKAEQTNISAGNAAKEATVSRDAEVRIFSSLGEYEDTLNLTAGGAAETVTAPDLKSQGYEFLYWAEGLGVKKHAVADTAEYTFVPKKGLTNLTAVYREIDSEYITVEFYNMNRALVKRYDTTYKLGDSISMEALPYMTGLGKANGWTLANTGVIYGETDTVEATEDAMIFVADYDTVAEDITVTVTNGFFSDGAVSDAFKYGDEVTVNAKARTADGKKFFAYWKKGSDIVSFEKAYSFNAYETCTVEAVYIDYETVAQKMRKIILDSITVGSETGLMAEFLIDDEEVIERGFVFGTGTPTVNDCSYKTAMTSDKKQFSIIDDSGLTARAYAILKDGVIYSK